MATGLALIALSFGGMASLDNDLQAAAEQTPGVERVKIVDVERDCERKREQRKREAASGREI